MHQNYVQDFGKQEGDICFVAEVDKKIVGAVWVRNMDDYGHVEDGVPSFAISLYKEYRGLGIGTMLMKRMLEELKERAGFRELLEEKTFERLVFLSRKRECRGKVEVVYDSGFNRLYSGRTF